jgi:hypothetical protein
MSRPPDPHAEIDTLCDALAVALALLDQYGLAGLTEDEMQPAYVRINRLDGEQSQSEIVQRGLLVMARNRAVH